MTYLLIASVIISTAVLVGCSSGFKKDGTTVVSYCLLGGVYMDESKVEAEREVAEYNVAQACPNNPTAPR